MSGRWAAQHPLLSRPFSAPTDPRAHGFSSAWVRCVTKNLGETWVRSLWGKFHGLRTYLRITDLLKSVIRVRPLVASASFAFTESGSILLLCHFYGYDYIVNSVLEPFWPYTFIQTGTFDFHDCKCFICVHRCWSHLTTDDVD